MRFNVYSDEELSKMQSFKLLQPGEYDFQVHEAKDTVSKKGSEMIQLQLKVWDKEGREYFVFDYLLEAFAYKIKHFCMATGLEDKWSNGSLSAEHCIGKCGTVDIYIQKSKDPQYQDKNAVKDYIVDDVSRRTSAAKQTGFVDSSLDDLPF